MTASRGKTKIICTLGPASSAGGTLQEMITGGMDIARLNFSHGTHEEHAAVLDSLRQAASRAGREVSVLQDLQGPKIRIGGMSVPSIELKNGERLVITTEQVPGGPGRVSTTYEGLPRDVRAGSDILLDDGRLRLRVIEVRGADVICTVERGGPLSAHKGINLPGVPVSAPSLTAKDRTDLEFGIGADVDYVALSEAPTTSASSARRSRRSVRRVPARSSWPRSRSPRRSPTSTRSYGPRTASWWRAATWAWSFPRKTSPCSRK
jgi:pyruvate kinase